MNCQNAAALKFLHFKEIIAPVCTRIRIGAKDDARRMRTGCEGRSAMQGLSVGC
jgi:hypothetical protein